MMCPNPTSPVTFVTTAASFCHWVDVLQQLPALGCRVWHWRASAELCSVYRPSPSALMPFPACPPADVAVAAPRPACSDKERARGDREVWECSGNAVGILEDVGMKVGGWPASCRACRSQACSLVAHLHAGLRHPGGWTSLAQGPLAVRAGAEPAAGRSLLPRRPSMLMGR